MGFPGFRRRGAERTTVLPYTGGTHTQCTPEACVLFLELLCSDGVEWQRLCLGYDMVTLLSI